MPRKRNEHETTHDGIFWRDGVWSKHFSMGFETGPDGKRKRLRRVFYGADPETVRRKIADATAREGGRLRGKIRAGTIAEWMTHWLADRAHSMSATGHANFSIVWRKHAEPIIGKKRLATFSAKDVRELYGELRNREVSPAQIKKIQIMLHSAFEAATRDEAYFGRNPFGLAERPKYKPKEHKSLTLEQAQKVVAAAIKSEDRHEAAVILAITCGMRLGEILGLKWRDINFKACYLTVRRSLQELNGRFDTSEGKTDTAPRKITLAPTALAALKRRKDIADFTAPDDWVFSTNTGQPMSRTNFRKRTFMPILKAAKVPQVRFHDLRHSFASLLLQEGTATKVVSEALGHSTPAITARIYQHTIGEMQSEAINTLDKALRSKRRT